MKFNLKVFPFFALLFFATSMTLVSCDSEESELLEIQERTSEQSEFQSERSGKSNHGSKGKRQLLYRLLKGDCVDITYPVTIDFPDGTSITAADQDELIDALQAYRESADTTSGTPTFVFPITLTVADSTFDVDSLSQLKQALKLCAEDRPGKSNRSCFDLVYPLTLENPDGELVQVADRSEFRQAIRQWKADNPDSDERPTLVYPIEIEYEDGSTATIASADELAAAKEACDD